MLKNLLHQCRSGIIFIFLRCHGSFCPVNRTIKYFPSHQAPYIIYMLVAPVPPGCCIIQVSGWLPLPQIFKTEHGIVPIGMYHDAVVTHFTSLVDPGLPLGQIPAGASTEEIMPIKDKPVPGQGFIFHFPAIETMPLDRHRQHIPGNVKSAAQLFQQGIGGMQQASFIGCGDHHFTMVAGYPESLSCLGKVPDFNSQVCRLRGKQVLYLSIPPAFNTRKICARIQLVQVSCQFHRCMFPHFRARQIADLNSRAAAG